MLATIAKTYERMLADRIAQNGSRDDSQFGCRPGPASVTRTLPSVGCWYALTRPSRETSLLATVGAVGVWRTGGGAQAILLRI